MYLKEVQMENFKSVKGQVNVRLNSGFTGITGPNGSGKSNITDAILFVIGPKSSKAIRAGNLLDLIWNGGEHGKPADKCRVTLVFDNTDRTMPIGYDEVHLTRVIKRSKENKQGYSSYFYINGNKSTLKEFEELLSYAGISSSGYNIVQQGDVTGIVKMGAVERRRILENIAGISQLDAEMEKARTERAELEANQEKIELIMEELRTRIKELEKDRKDALRYRELNDKMRLAQAQLSYRRLKNAEAELRSKTQAIESFEKEIGDAKKELESLEKRAKEIMAEIERTDEEIAGRWGEEGKKIKEQIDSYRLAMARAEQEIERAEDDIESLKKAISVEEKRLNEEKERYSSMKEGFESLKEEKDALSAKIENAEKEHDGLKNRFSSSSRRGRELREGLNSMRSELVSETSKLGKSREMAAKLEERIRSAKEQRAAYEEEMKKVEFEIKDARWQRDSLKKGGKYSAPQIKKMKQEAFQLRVEEREISTEMSGLQREISSLAERYAELRAKSGNTGSRAVNAILQARDRGELKGIIGSVSELISYDEKYATAMQVAAGARMNAIVVENDEAGARAIRYLKSNRLGRAVFLPLNKMKAGRPRGTTLMTARKDGVVDFAMELAEYDERYRNAMWYVFGETLVVKDLDTARRLMGGVRLVTPGGELIEASGAMAGGNLASSKANSKVLRDLEDVSRRLRQKRERLEELSARLSEIRPRMEELESMLSEADMDAETLAKIESYEMKIRETEARKKLLEEKIKSISSAIDKDSKELNAIQTEISELETSVKYVEAKISEMESEMESLMPEDMQARMEELESMLSELTEKRASLDSEMSRIGAEMRALESSMAERSQRIENMRLKIESAGKLIDAKKKEHSSVKQELDTLLTMNKGMEKEMEELRRKRDMLLDEKSSVISGINTLKDRIHGKEDYVLGLRAQIESINSGIAEAKEEYASYGIEVNEPVPSMDRLKKTIRSCDLEISALGSVNFRAIEDYDAQSERYSEMESEMNKIEEQKAELIKLENELEEKKRDGFFRVFSAVNENFRRVYSEVSGGGDGYLELENPDSPFEGGMHIIARPRGKKVTRIEALSGGEKGLVALSFIFAIQEYDPSAFYIFDEADQNLDSLNAEIMARRIKISSSRAQFLMVSLRKAALKYADDLIGVTSLGDGVTRIIQQLDIDSIVEPDEPEGSVEVKA